MLLNAQSVMLIYSFVCIQTSTEIMRYATLKRQSRIMRSRGELFKSILKVADVIIETTSDNQHLLFVGELCQLLYMCQIVIKFT